MGNKSFFGWFSNQLHELMKREKDRPSNRREEKEENIHHVHEHKSNDRISDFPDAILEHILSFLPAKSIARTSVLSRRWRYLWLSCPVFDFTYLRDAPLIYMSTYEVQKIVDVHTTAMQSISTVLSRRKEKYSNLKVFRVSGYMSESRLHDFIHWVAKHKVEELELEVVLLTHVDAGKVLQCLIDCTSLRSLTLSSVEHRYKSYYYLRLKAKDVLHSLQTLDLTHVTLDLDGVDWFSSSSLPSLETLFIGFCHIMGDHLKVSCPNLRNFYLLKFKLNILDISGSSLEILKVESFSGDHAISSLNISAPNLQTFHWLSYKPTEECSIKSFPMLKTFHLGIRTPFFRPEFTSMEDKTYSMVVNELLSASSQVQTLFIRSGAEDLEILSNIYFGGGLPFSFMKLETLVVMGTCLRKREIPGLACLLSNSPVVHTLEIGIPSQLYFVPDEMKWNNDLLDAEDWSEEQYWESQAENLSPFLSNLRVVKFNLHQNHFEIVITMARFLLAHGSGLQQMIISGGTMNHNDLPLWKGKLIDLLKGFPHASAHVKISVSSNLLMYKI